MISSSLLHWLEKPDCSRGIHFGVPDGSWQFCSYAWLADSVRSAAQAIRTRGVKPGDVVMIVSRSGPEFVSAFFGSVAAGALPSPIAPPLVFQDPESYRTHLAAVVGVASPALVLTEQAWLPQVREAARGATVIAFEDLSSPGVGGAIDVPQAGPHSLLQFTSGSSGPPRGVRVSTGALEANVAAIHAWLRWSRDDTFASWLPLHHDMGLVGGLICAVVRGGTLWLLPPEEFIRRPLRYFECFAQRGAQLTVTPCFGLSYLLRRLEKVDLTGVDLSSLRGIVVGAERIDPAVLDRFHRRLEPCGLSRRSLLPAYGLAEATLAVTGDPLDEEWICLNVDPESLGPGRRVSEAGVLDGNGSKDVQAVETTRVVGCGKPVEGVRVSIEDEQGEPLPERHVGEIIVRGRSVADGYVGEQQSTATRLSGGELRTGDAGFLAGGQLFVLGRLGDSMKVRGRIVFAEELEMAAVSTGAVRQRITVLLGAHRGQATVVILSEHTAAPWKAAAMQLFSDLAGDARVVFWPVPRGTLVRTSSGKPRRRYLWNLWTAGDLPAISSSNTAPSACPNPT